MADITKDSFNEANDFTKVVFQRGRDLLDFELNEFQDILRVFSARLGQVGVGLWQAAAATPSYPYSSDNGLKVVPNGVANQVQISAGTYLIDGIVQDFTIPLTVTLPAADVTVKYDVIYIAAIESEVADPNAVPQIGPTTVRRQVAVTVQHYRTATLPIDSSFPANPATWLWQGQTRYYAVAVVTRPASTNAIVASNIFDLRQQTPSRTLAEAARVENFTLQALITPTLETPVRNVAGIDNALLIDINKSNSAVAVGLDDTFTLRSRANGGAGIPQTMAVLTRYAALTNGVPGRLAVGSNYAIYGTPTLRFQDDYTVANGYSGVSDKFVRFSSSLGSGALLRIGEQSASVQNAVGVLSAQNLLKAINGRLHVTVGDGTVSFGDFNGVDAIDQALQYYYAATTAGGVITSFEIDVKRGTYTVGASTAIEIPANRTVTLTGDNPLSTVIQVNAAATGGIAVLSNVNLTLRRIKLAGGSASAPLLSASGNSTLVVEDCLLYSNGYNTIINGVASATFRRTEFKAVTAVSDVPLVQVRVGGSIAADLVRFEECLFNTKTQNNVPVVRLLGAGSYTTSATLQSLEFVGCKATLGGAVNSAAAWNPTAVNTGLIDIKPNNANINNVASVTGIKRIVIESCDIDVTGVATTDCLVALRLTATGVGDFSGTLFSGGFMTVDYVQIRGLNVTLDAGSALSTSTAISPFLIGLYHAHLDIEDVIIRNTTTTAVGMRNGKIPYDAYSYFTPDGTVAPAPNTGLKATDAIAGVESAAVCIANRWYGLFYYALTELAKRNPQPTTLINNLRIYGFERGSDSIHTCGGELFVHASGTYAYLSDIEISNYQNSQANTRIYAPESRLKLMTSRLDSGGLFTVPSPIMDVSRVNMTGYYARAGAAVAVSLTTPGSGYTDGFYAGQLAGLVTPAPGRNGLLLSLIHI